MIMLLVLVVSSLLVVVLLVWVIKNVFTHYILTNMQLFSQLLLCTAVFSSYIYLKILLKYTLECTKLHNFVKRNPSMHPYPLNRLTVLLIVVAMNIDVFKLFLPKMAEYLIKDFFKNCLFFFRGSLKHSAQRYAKNSWPFPTQILHTPMVIEKHQFIKE